MVNPNKYPRTYHWPSSPCVASDDKTLHDVSSFINVSLIITEKLDGGNCSIRDGKVFARSTGQQTICPSFSFIKAKHAWKSSNWGQNMTPYGENMFAKHSIFYDSLTDFFYVFGVKEEDEWVSWEELKAFCYEHDFNHVPVIAEGVSFNSEKELSKFLASEITKPSQFGATREGFVIRNANRFHTSAFSENICKYVRANHVQTDVHWSKNWTPNKMN